MCIRDSFKDGDTFFNGFVKFYIVVVFEENQVVFVLRVGEVLRDGEVAALNVLVPMGQLPCVAVRVAVDHPLMHDLRRRFDPDDSQRRALFGQLGLQVGHERIVAHLLRERCVDEHDVVVVQRLHRQRQHAVILVIADVLLEEVAAAVIGLPGNLEDLLRQDDQGVLVEIDNVMQFFRQRLGDECLAAGGRGSDEDRCV